MFIGVACCECHGVIAKTVHIKVIRWVIRLHLPPHSPRWMFIGSTPYYCSIEYMFEHVFRISVTGMPPLFFMTFCSYCSMECDTAGHKWSILSFFITWCARQISTPKQYLFRIHMHLKKNIYFGLSSKKDNHPGPLSRAERYLADLAESFFLPSQGPLILIICFSVTLSGLGLRMLTMCELPRRVS